MDWQKTALKNFQTSLKTTISPSVSHWYPSLIAHCSLLQAVRVCGFGVPKHLLTHGIWSTRASLFLSFFDFCDVLRKLCHLHYHSNAVGGFDDLDDKDDIGSIFIALQITLTLQLQPLFQLYIDSMIMAHGVNHLFSKVVTRGTKKSPTVPLK